MRHLFDYLFSENGLVIYQPTDFGYIEKAQTIKGYLGDKDYETFKNFLDDYVVNSELGKYA